MGSRCFWMVCNPCLGLMLLLLGPAILANNVNELGVSQLHLASDASSIQPNQGNSPVSGSNSEQNVPKVNNGPKAKPRPAIKPIETIQKRERTQPRQ